MEISIPILIGKKLQSVLTGDFSLLVKNAFVCGRVGKLEIAYYSLVVEIDKLDTIKGGSAESYLYSIKDCINSSYSESALEKFGLDLYWSLSGSLILSVNQLFYIESDPFYRFIVKGE